MPSGHRSPSSLFTALIGLSIASSHAFRPTPFVRQIEISLISPGVLRRIRPGHFSFLPCKFSHDRIQMTCLGGCRRRRTRRRRWCLTREDQCTGWRKITRRCEINPENDLHPGSAGGSVPGSSRNHSFLWSAVLFVRDWFAWRCGMWPLKNSVDAFIDYTRKTLWTWK